MSRAFVKEQDVEASEDLPDKPLSPHTNYVTPKGLAQLQARYAELQALRAELAARDDMPACQELPSVRRELRYVEQRLKSAVMVTPDQQPTDRVHFGATVEVLDSDDRLHVYQIVGEDEADASSGRISWVSPLARALLNGRIGDVVTWHRPAGDVDLEIVAVRRGEA